MSMNLLPYGNNTGISQSSIEKIERLGKSTKITTYTENCTFNK